MENGTNNHPNNDGTARGEEVVESLLKLASSRPEPCDDHRHEVRVAVKDEWQVVTGRRRWRRRAAGFSVAATVMLLVTLVMLNRDGSSTVPGQMEMARVDRISGRVRVLGVQSQGNGTTLGQQMPVYVGQTLNTGTGSGMALRLGSGISLRVDELTEITLLGQDVVKLKAGRVYVDTQDERSGNDSAAGMKARFEVLTDRGAVRHVGTQYMVSMGEERLAVSVRKGSVQVISEESEGPLAKYVKDGMELSVDEFGEVEISPTVIFGGQWQWAENLGSGYVLDLRTMAEFLEWVATETGREVRYESAAAEAVAEETVLHGTVNLPAREALDLILMTSDLSAEIQDGVIEVRLNH